MLYSIFFIIKLAQYNVWKNSQHEHAHTMQHVLYTRMYAWADLEQPKQQCEYVHSYLSEYSQEQNIRLKSNIHAYVYVCMYTHMV